MKTYWSAAWVGTGVLAATVALSAQSGSTRNNSRETRANDVVTLAGCIQNAPLAVPARAEGASPAVENSGAEASEPATAVGTSGKTVSGGDSAAANNRAGRIGVDAGRDPAGSSANVPDQTGHPRVYVLNDAGIPGVAKNRAVAGTSGTTPVSYQLEGDMAAISGHLNHQVAIVGTVEKKDAPAASILHVQSVKLISERCETDAPRHEPRETTR